MPIELPEKCLREGVDCVPFAQIVSDDRTSFICCGMSYPDDRSRLKDPFRHCFKNDSIDTMHDNDERDLVDTISVLVQALSVHHNFKAMWESLSEDEPCNQDDALEDYKTRVIGSLKKEG